MLPRLGNCETIVKSRNEKVIFHDDILGEVILIRRGASIRTGCGRWGGLTMVKVDGSEQLMEP